jgi:hypothetical protein
MFPTVPLPINVDELGIHQDVRRPFDEASQLEDSSRGGGPIEVMASWSDDGLADGSYSSRHGSLGGSGGVEGKGAELAPLTSHSVGCVTSSDCGVR